jgi:hypothetical protein
LPSISWSTSQSRCSQIYIQYLFKILFSSILCTCPNQRNLGFVVPCIFKYSLKQRDAPPI